MFTLSDCDILFQLRGQQFIKYKFSKQHSDHFFIFRNLI